MFNRCCSLRSSIDYKLIHNPKPIILSNNMDKIIKRLLWYVPVNVNIRMYNFDDVQCTVIPSVAYGFVTGMNLQLC